MNTTKTIFVTSQGHIYRCPECHKADRIPSFAEDIQCRFCAKSIKLQETSNYSDDLKDVYREIHSLEMGNHHSQMDISGYFESKRIRPPELKRLYQSGIEGKRIVEITASLLMKQPSAEELINGDMFTYHEIVEEAKMILLMENNPNLTISEKRTLLEKHGFKPFVNNGIIGVFFASSIAPECDSYVYWR
jgi:hypothetical protein